MNSKTVVSAIMAVALATGGSAFGQGYGDPRDPERLNDQQSKYGDQVNRRDNQARQPDRRQDRGRANLNDRRGDERGAGPEHAFHRGQRLPSEYNHRQYVVDDWRGHNLKAPPRGYHWVQVGGDYVLVAITTGIILQLLLNN